MGKGGKRVSLDEMVKLIDGGESLGPILFVLTLPMLLPLPPGVSMVIAPHPHRLASDHGRPPQALAA